MSSLYLSRLSDDERKRLIERLHETQNGNCFICGSFIDLELHKDTIDIDHIIPLQMRGQDNETNLALTHTHCNRSKQDSDLNVARIIQSYEKIKSDTNQSGRSPNLNDILVNYGGAKYDLVFKIEGDQIKYSFAEIGDTKIYQQPVYEDQLSGFKYFFALLPIEYVYHDDKINPRPIGSNLSKLIKEFYKKRPQLHVSLAWIDDSESKAKIRVFDGQHKAAAQILLNTKYLPARVFINPNEEVLLSANTNAGTNLRQVAFDKSVQRHLGSKLYLDRIERFIKERGLPDNEYDFSEQDLVSHFRGESLEMKKYIIDSIRDYITYCPDNGLREYIELGGKNPEKPLSYSSIEKTFYSFFICQKPLTTPINYRLEEGENPRELEKHQIVKIMDIIAEVIYIGKYSLDIGASRIEHKIQKGENIPLEHIKAYRLSREEILYTWLKCVLQIIMTFFIMQGKPLQQDRVFQYKFPDSLRDRIRTFVVNMHNLPVWINKDLSSTVFGGKQVYSYWQTIFETGKSPQGVQVLSKPIDLMELISDTNSNQ